jgi:hypothetical protein
MGKLEAARLLFEEAVQVSKETLGDGHPYTLIFTVLHGAPGLAAHVQGHG